MEEYHHQLPPDLLGVVDGLLEKLNFTPTELLTLGLFLYHPDIFQQASIDEVKLIIFLNENEQKWLGVISEHYNKPKLETLVDILLDRDSLY